MHNALGLFLSASYAQAVCLTYSNVSFVLLFLFKFALQRDAYHYLTTLLVK